MTTTQLIIANIILIIIAYEIWQHDITIKDKSHKKEKNKLTKKNTEQ